MAFRSQNYGIISFKDYLSKGITEINLLTGEAFNLDPNAAIKRVTFKGAKKFNMGRIKSLAIFTDAEISLILNNGELENDMNTFIRSLRPVDLETIRIKQDPAYVPDKYLVIIVASDDPNFMYDILSARPHVFYTNEVTAIAASYTTLFFRHTLGEKNKFKIFNGAVGINLDIQHRETPESDAADSWVSYEGFPQVLAAGNTYNFGDDALQDTQHHFHRVRVQSTGADVQVKGAHFNI